MIAYKACKNCSCIIVIRRKNKYNKYITCCASCGKPINIKK